MLEKFPNLERDMDTHHQSQRSLNRLNSKRSSERDLYSKRYSPRHNKLSKIKNKVRIFKVVREKVFIYKGYSVKLSADFPVETLQARRQWDDIFKVLKVKIKKCQLRILYLSCPSEIKERKGPSQTNKAKGVHHHQKSISSV